MAQYTGKKLDTALHYITQYLRTNHMTPGDRLPTEKQLVEATGLSRVTVRRALENLQESGKIHSVQGSGYYVSRPDAVKKAGNIPMVLSYSSTSSRVLEIVRGAQNYLESINCELNLTVTGRNTQQERELIERLYQAGIRQAIILPTSSEDNREFFFQIIQAGMNLIFIDRKPRDISCCHLVQADNITGGYLATRHLIEKGHRKIAVFGLEPISNTSSISERYAGYCAAMQSAKLPIPEHSYFYANYQRTSLDIDELLDPAYGVTGICAIHDTAALEIIRHARSRGIRVPQELSVVGFDNLDITRQFAPSISTIDQPFAKVGAAAAEIAYNCLMGKQEGYTHRLLPVTLIPRESVVAPQITY